MENYIVYGLMRSGNHAIIEWIAAHFTHVAHHNDITRVGPNRYKEYGTTEVPIDSVIYSLETWSPFSLTFPVRGLSIPRDVTRIAILRDYYNMQASIIRFGQKHGWARNVYRLHKTLWPEFAEAYLEKPDDFIVFNHWVEDPDYCRKIEERYGWRQVARQLTMPASGIGLGSSFDDYGELRHGELNRRWLEMKSDNPAWADAMACPQAAGLNRQIFGWTAASAESSFWGESRLIHRSRV